MARYTEEFKQEAARLYKSGDAGVAKTAKGIGVAPESLRSWIRKYDGDVRVPDIAERERLRQAESEVKRLEEENEILKKAAALQRVRRPASKGDIRLYRRRTRQPYRLHSLQSTGCARAGHYAWKSRPTSEHELKDAELSEHILETHAGSRGIHGSPRIHAVLKREGVRTSRKRAGRLMREYDIQGVSKSKKGQGRQKIEERRRRPPTSQKGTSMPINRTDSGSPTSPM